MIVRVAMMMVIDSGDGGGDGGDVNVIANQHQHRMCTCLFSRSLVVWLLVAVWSIWPALHV